MLMLLGDPFPDFHANTTIGSIQFHDWLGDDWGILFSHPADFTPVCTTELARAANLFPEFAKRKVKILALSCDSVDSHQAWINDIKKFGKIIGDGFPFPIIADEQRVLATQLGMLDPVEKDAQGIPLTCRAVFVINPSKKLALSILYPATTGRNFDEILRIIDSLQLTASKKVATPVDWKPGNECMIAPSLSEEEAQKNFSKYESVKVPSGKNYIRMTKDV